MQVKDTRQFKRLLVVNDVSARQLAAGVGYASHTSINRMAAGQAVRIPVDKARAIARYLKVDVDDLFVPYVSSASRRSDHRDAS